MGYSKTKIIRFFLLSIFFVCMLVANFYAIRKMGQYGVELYFYDKLLVAYNVAGKSGLQEELLKISVSDQFPREKLLANGFKKKINELNDPGAFLEEKVSQNKEEVTFYKNLRIWAFILMAVVLAWRLFIDFVSRQKSRNKPA